MHEKQTHLQQLTEKKLNEKRLQKEEKELEECSFRPKLTKVKRGIYSSSKADSPIRYYLEILTLL